MVFEDDVPEELAGELRRVAEKKPDPLDVLREAAGEVDPLSLRSVVHNFMSGRRKDAFPDPAEPAFTFALGQKFGLSERTISWFNRCGRNVGDNELLSRAGRDWLPTGPQDETSAKKMLRLFEAVFNVATGADTDLGDALDILTEFQAETEK